jgi:uncharacterized protein
LNKKKILNDPVYGFINIPGELIFDIIEHPYFQRLRRIRQLGLAEFVYPGALHTRFHHALGAMHLMSLALNTLRSKGHDISDKEFESAQLAILLHDIGHGPLSHALENSILSKVHHEKISSLITQELNKQFNGALDLSIKMFNNTYKRKFFHQLISGQLDMDRMDYLKRDCFFTGVQEGTIGTDRIIRMLEIVNDELVVEEKGIYSIENFLTARRLMYWQVYLHKTTVSAENMVIQVIKRARFLLKQGIDVPASNALKLFLSSDVQYADFKNHKKYLEAFTQMDDLDVWYGIKQWIRHKDRVLSCISRLIIERKLYKILVSNKLKNNKPLLDLQKDCKKRFQLNEDEIGYFVVKGHLSNAAYLEKNGKINILRKDGSIIDVAEASDLPNIKAISKIVKKHYICWPKSVYL